MLAGLIHLTRLELLIDVGRRSARDLSCLADLPALQWLHLRGYIMTVDDLFTGFLERLSSLAML